MTDGEEHGGAPLGGPASMSPLFAELGEGIARRMVERQTRLFGPVTAMAATWKPSPVLEALLMRAQRQAASTSLIPFNTSLFEQYRRLIQPILDNLPSGAIAVRGVWPANLSDLMAGYLDVDTLKALMMDEHLPIAWVPRAATVKLILAAKTPGRRRVIYGQKWLSVLEDCDELAGRMDSIAVAPYVGFLKCSIAAV